ncbi:MAG: UMP kinase [Erysipelotrichaceae bacterium]|nr:UMP kinase [Erysipelotrichaceae bacterium]
MYKRILLKLSGESISADDFPYSAEKLDDLAEQIRKIKEMGVEIGIVIGGGNICRGKLFEKLGFERVQADYAGMLGTVINALMLCAKLNQIGIKATVMSAVKAESVLMFDKEEANRLLEEGEVLVFGGGVGKPYHSTDTGSAQRAIDINADVILMAKSGVDGVYDSDPDTNPDAKRFDELTFDDILNLELKVIDLQAAQLCRDAGIGAFVFNMSGEDNIVKAVKGETTGTVIKC